MKFIANSLAAESTESVAMRVLSGAGDDHIATGGGQDVIDPGAGADLVHGGFGYNEFLATAAPDAPDTYESSGFAQLSYAQRTTPVELTGSTAGAPGEGDHLVGVLAVVGGAGDDRLDGWDAMELDGGPGDDQLFGPAAVVAGSKNVFLYGGPGDDLLVARGGGINHLVGEAGNDVSRGGPGLDIIRDLEERDTRGLPLVAIPTSEGGEDLAFGGGGDDAIELGSETDRGYGGPGDDDLDGGAGADTLAGGEGADHLVGDFGFDHLYGGRGSDTLFSGRWQWTTTGKVFPFAPAANDGPDRDACGPGHDTAVANPWDELHDCEAVKIVRGPGSR